MRCWCGAAQGRRGPRCLAPAAQLRGDAAWSDPVPCSRFPSLRGQRPSLSSVTAITDPPARSAAAFPFAVPCVFASAGLGESRPFDAEILLPERAVPLPQGSDYSK